MLYWDTLDGATNDIHLCESILLCVKFALCGFIVLWYM